MTKIKLGLDTVNTAGELPAIGSVAPDATLTKADMKDVSLTAYRGEKVLLNIFPSVDTSVCATSVREFNKRCAALTNTKVLCISKDLPFAQKRFCGAEGIENVEMLSDFRGRGFGKSYGVEMTEGNLAGLFARAIVVLDKQGKVIYTQLTDHISDSVDFDSALAALAKS